MSTLFNESVRKGASVNRTIMVPEPDAGDVESEDEHATPNKAVATIAVERRVKRRCCMCISCGCC